MILGTEAIREALEDGRIICDPKPVRIEGAHIDVTLGEWTWLLEVDDDVLSLDLGTDDPSQRFHLMHHSYSHTDAMGVWFPPRSFSLAHTVEYIGTAPDSGIVPVLHTRSTLARWGLTVHLSAGLGDVGYASRWTLEIINPHDFSINLPVGARVGCIVFQQVIGGATAYQPGTRYNIQRSSWTPEAMLPRKGNW